MFNEFDNHTDEQAPGLGGAPELLKMMMPYLPYSLLIKLSTLAKNWKAFIEENSTLPLIKDDIINKAKLNASSANRTFYISFHLSPDSIDSLISRYKSKRSRLIEGTWIDEEPSYEEMIPVMKVFMFAFRLHEYWQYITLNSREMRHQFITRYMALPDKPYLPRWKFLSDQSQMSLERLKESLGRYTDKAYHAHIQDVDSAIKAKK